MILRSTDKIATHLTKKGSYTMIHLFVGPNPYGPLGGTCGNITDAVRLMSSWYPAHALFKLKNRLENLIPKSGEIEINLEDLTTKSKFDASRGLYAWEVYHSPVEELPLLITHPHTPKVKAKLEDRLKSER